MSDGFWAWRPDFPIMNKTRLIQAGLALLAGMLLAWLWWSNPRDTGAFLVFDQRGSNSAIIVPQDATPEEISAARLLSETLAKAAGIETKNFPIQRESWWRFWQQGVFVGNTLRAKQLA